MKFLLALILFLGGCSTLPALTPNLPAKALRPVQVIYLPEYSEIHFDARHGDTLIYVMESADYDLVNPQFLIARCDYYGGELIYNPFTLIWTCEGVNF